MRESEWIKKYFMFNSNVNRQLMRCDRT